jgi:chitin disaccharide deacetylase
MGHDPSHLDSHQHVHREEPVRSMLRTRATQLGVRMRDEPGIAYTGAFYGQSGKGTPYPEGIKVEALMRIISELPEGITELGCHPGLDRRLDSSYRLERLEEVDTLCHPRIKAAVARAGVSLRSFFTI